MDYEEATRAILREVPGTLAVYLFGSRAAATAGSESDVDLAILTALGLEPLARWRLQEDLAALLHASVDLVDLRRASTVMRAQIVTTGTVLHEGDAAARALFEATVLSDYARLNEERGAILADIRARGTIHG